MQDFIHTARRCQDLWFGSQLLSDLSLAAAGPIGEFAGADGVIFPGGHTGGDAGVANRVLAVLPEGCDPIQVAAAAEQAHRNRLDHLCNEIFAPFEDDPHVDLTRARAQIAELMEWNWVAVPLPNAAPPGETPYSLARKTAEGWLSAQKAHKAWSQPGWDPGRGVPKSSLDGEREGVISERLYDAKTRGNAHLAKYRLKAGERLCGIGLLKRLGADPEGRHARRAFHSTSHVAMGPLLERIEAGNFSQAVDRYLGVLRDCGLDLARFAVSGGSALQGYDGELLLESRMNDHFDEASTLEGPDRERAAAEARGALHVLLHAIGVGEPSPYYAFLLADGDRMGRAIDALKHPMAHRTLSESLNAFAAGCSDVVKRHRGSLIFAGGDDVMALLPLHRAVSCARDLADQFRDQVGAVATSLGVPDTDRPTLSVGLGVLHCREDMAEARKLAARAEKLAKKTRNALGVIVSKRSGSDLEVRGTWDEDLDGRLGAWAAALTEGTLSRKASHDLEAVVTHFANIPAVELLMRQDEIVAYFQYICASKRVVGGETKVAEAMRARLEQAIVGGGGAPTPGPLHRIQQLVCEIQVADLISRAQRDAPPRKET